MDQERAPGTGARRTEETADRRRHRRFLEEVRVRFRDLEASAPSRWGRTRDLSLGGLCLLTERPVEVGSHLALELHVESEPAPILALGKVLRASRDEGGTYVSGLQFLWVGAEDRGNLQRLAAHFRARYGVSG